MKRLSPPHTCRSPRADRIDERYGLQVRQRRIGITHAARQADVALARRGDCTNAVPEPSGSEAVGQDHLVARCDQFLGPAAGRAARARWIPLESCMITTAGKMPGPLRLHQFGGNLLDATCGRIGRDGDAARGAAGQRDQQGER